MTPDDALALARLRDDVARGRVAEIRRERGHLTQREVARAVGTTPAAVGGWESGRRMPRGTAALRYAQLLAELERQYADRHALAEATCIEELPAWAQKLIRDIRAEAAEHRTRTKELAEALAEAEAGLDRADVAELGLDATNLLDAGLGGGLG